MKISPFRTFKIIDEIKLIYEFIDEVIDDFCDDLKFGIKIDKYTDLISVDKSYLQFNGNELLYYGDGDFEFFDEISTGMEFDDVIDKMVEFQTSNGFILSRIKIDIMIVDYPKSLKEITKVYELIDLINKRILNEFAFLTVSEKTWRTDDDGNISLKYEFSVNDLD